MVNGEFFSFHTRFVLLPQQRRRFCLTGTSNDVLYYCRVYRYFYVRSATTASLLPRRLCSLSLSVRFSAHTCRGAHRKTIDCARSSHRFTTVPAYDTI